jgi:hypothetical protein
VLSMPVVGVGCWGLVVEGLVWSVVVVVVELELELTRSR